MKQLSLNADAEQFITEYLDNGEVINFKFNYRPNAMGWFFDFTYKDLVRKNIRLCTGVGSLMQFRNLLPIDLYVKSSNVLDEPYLIGSFKFKFVEVYLVSHDERDAIIDGTFEF